MLVGMSKTQALQINGRLLVHPFAVNQSQDPATQRLAAEENIRRHVQIVEHVQFLVNETDAIPRGVGDRVDSYRFTVNEDFPGVRLMNAAEDFHQG